MDKQVRRFTDKSPQRILFGAAIALFVALLAVLLILVWTIVFPILKAFYLGD